MQHGIGLNQGVFVDVSSVDTGDIDLSLLTASLPSMIYYPLTTASELDARIADADVVITNKVILDGDCLRRHAHLRLICIAATGSNNVDLQAARQQGIAVCNVRAYATPSVVQHVFALILALQTRLYDLRQAMQGGAWSRSPHFCLLD